MTRLLQLRTSFSYYSRLQKEELEDYWTTNPIMTRLHLWMLGQKTDLTGRPTILFSSKPKQQPVHCVPRRTLATNTGTFCGVVAVTFEPCRCKNFKCVALQSQIGKCSTCYSRQKVPVCFIFLRYFFTDVKIHPQPFDDLMKTSGATAHCLKTFQLVTLSDWLHPPDKFHSALDRDALMWLMTLSASTNQFGDVLFCHSVEKYGKLRWFTLNFHVTFDFSTVVEVLNLSISIFCKYFYSTIQRKYCTFYPITFIEEL